MIDYDSLYYEVLKKSQVKSPKEEAVGVLQQLNKTLIFEKKRQKNKKEAPVSDAYVEKTQKIQQSDIKEKENKSFSLQSCYLVSDIEGFLENDFSLVCEDESSVTDNALTYILGVSGYYTLNSVFVDSIKEGVDVLLETGLRKFMATRLVGKEVSINSHKFIIFSDNLSMLNDQSFRRFLYFLMLDRFVLDLGATISFQGVTPKDKRTTNVQQLTGFALLRSMVGLRADQYQVPLFQTGVSNQADTILQAFHDRKDDLLDIYLMLCAYYSCTNASDSKLSVALTDESGSVQWQEITFSSNAEVERMFKKLDQQMTQLMEKQATPVKEVAPVIEPEVLQKIVQNQTINNQNMSKQYQLLQTINKMQFELGQNSKTELQVELTDETLKQLNQSILDGLLDAKFITAFGKQLNQSLMDKLDIVTLAIADLDKQLKGQMIGLKNLLNKWTDANTSNVDASGLQGVVQTELYQLLSPFRTEVLTRLDALSSHVGSGNTSDEMMQSLSLLYDSVGQLNQTMLQMQATQNVNDVVTQLVKQTSDIQTELFALSKNAVFTEDFTHHLVQEIVNVLPTVDTTDLSQQVQDVLVSVSDLSSLQDICSDILRLVDSTHEYNQTESLLQNIVYGHLLSGLVQMQVLDANKVSELMDEQGLRFATDLVTYRRNLSEKLKEVGE